MSEPSRKRPRITPRNSEADAEVAAAANITPFNDVFGYSGSPQLTSTELTNSQLHQLGKVIYKPNTPQARTPASASSASRSAAKVTSTRTPNTAGRTPGRTPTGTIRSATRFSARRGPPTTPHAIRALQQRRNAALTPGRDRRRSGRGQRETPRDDLRNLSRLLAKHSQPIEPSPQVPHSTKKAIRRDLLEDEENEPPPRLSVPLEDDDTGSWHEPPRLSLALDEEEETATVRSVEEARRVRLGRESYGDPSFTDRIAALDGLIDDEADYEDGDIRSAPVLGDADLEVGEFTGPLSDGYDSMIEANMHFLTPRSEATGELRRAIFGENQGRISGISGISGSPPALSDGEPTFQFRFPDRRRSTLVPQPLAADTAQDLIDDEVAVDDDIQQYYESDASDDGQAVATSTRKAAAPPDPLAQARAARRPATREMRVSKHGTEYPALPAKLVKSVAQNLARQHSGNGKIGKDALLALQQASEWFFEQCVEDVAVFADHAGRRTVDEADVVALMRRQRLLGGPGHHTLFSLAQRVLPRELLQEVRMGPPQVKMAKARKRKRLERIDEADEDVTM